MIKVVTEVNGRVSQGDIYKNIEYVEHVSEIDGNILLSKVVFPQVIVLTQDCDLEQYFTKFLDLGKQDKFLFSVIVAPLYNAEHVFSGTHLEGLELTMQTINKKSSHGNFLLNNEIPRYHYLEFPEDIEIVPSIIDFKHYFTVHVQYLSGIKKTNFICRVNELYRESICQRFANYLSRIALP